MFLDVKEITVPYLFAKANTCSVNSLNIELKKTDPQGLLKKLEDGENLFDVLGFFGEGLKDFPLRFAYFKQVEAIQRKGKRFFDEDHTQIGKLLVPKNQLVTRRAIEKKYERAKKEDSRIRYEKLLEENPSVESFYIVNCGNTQPVYSDKVLILCDNQLKTNKLKFLS